MSVPHSHEIQELNGHKAAQEVEQFDSHLTAPDWVRNAPMPDDFIESSPTASTFSPVDASSAKLPEQASNNSDDTHHPAKKQYPILNDAWDTSRETVQKGFDAESSSNFQYAGNTNKPVQTAKAFDPSSFVSQSLIVPAKVEASQDETIEDEGERQYITTHTPHVWLDQYIDHSRELSPRGFNALHEAAGLWAMSATVAGRVVIDYGGRLRHTSLQIAAVARSSVWVKSHTIGIADKMLLDAGLDWRLLPTKATPQAIIEEMSDSRHILDLMRELETEEDEQAFEKLQKKLDYFKDQMGRLYAHEGQRAWYLSEFGTKIIAGMMRPGSSLAEFSDFLRDINEKVGRDYEYRTRGHGKENISSPCLSIIADTTPADIRPYARAGAPLWSNGFFPRFALIAPLATDVPSLAQVGYETKSRTVTPFALTSIMVEVDKKLGGRTSYDERLPLRYINYSKGIHQKIYQYEKWVIANRLETEDLDGTYKRLVFEQSVSIATLLALFDDSFEIMPRHYQRSLEICEMFRRCTEDFYLGMTESVVSQKDLEKSQKEDRVLRIIQKHHDKKGSWPTLRDIRKQTGPTRYRMSNEDIGKILDVLKEANLIEEHKEPKARAYRYKVT